MNDRMFTLDDAMACLDSYGNPIKLGGVYEATAFSHELDEGELVKITGLELVYGIAAPDFDYFYYSRKLPRERMYVIARGLVMRGAETRIIILRELNCLKPIEDR